MPRTFHKFPYIFVGFKICQDKNSSQLINLLDYQRVCLSGWEKFQTFPEMVMNPMVYFKQKHLQKIDVSQHSQMSRGNDMFLFFSGKYWQKKHRLLRRYPTRIQMQASVVDPLTT